MSEQKELKQKLNKALEDAATKVEVPAVTATTTMEIPVAQAINKIRPDYDRENDSFWYLNRTGKENMNLVTSAGDNPALGIERITFVEGKTERQTEKNIFGRITIDTNIGTIGNITIFFDERTEDGRFPLRFANPSYRRNNDDPEAKTKYVSDIKIKDAVKAQVLTWLHYQVRSNREYAIANGIQF